MTKNQTHICVLSLLLLFGLAILWGCRGLSRDVPSGGGGGTIRTLIPGLALCDKQGHGQIQHVSICVLERKISFLVNWPVGSQTTHQEPQSEYSFHTPPQKNPLSHDLPTCAFIQHSNYALYPLRRCHFVRLKPRILQHYRNLFMKSVKLTFGQVTVSCWPWIMTGNCCPPCIPSGILTM